MQPCKTYWRHMIMSKEHKTESARVKIFSGTHSSCRASGLKLLLAFNQVVLVFTFGTVNKKELEKKKNFLFCYYNLRGLLYKPVHDKTYKMACAPSQDSDQPGHPPSLIGIFAVHMKIAWVLSYPLSTQQ